MLLVSGLTTRTRRCVLSLIEPFVYDFTRTRQGSVSAEHGVGLAKNCYLGHSKSAAAIALMRGIKQQFDPHGILNPYKMLPPSEDA